MTVKRLLVGVDASSFMSELRNGDVKPATAFAHFNRLCEELAPAR